MLNTVVRSRPANPDAAESIGRLAIRCLYAELSLSPKPGLVCPGDPGSHSDMDASTFYRSLFSLRGYFRAMAKAGADYADFDPLRQMALAAETRMLAATGGVNTHRGAIFNLGLLAAAAGQIDTEGGSLNASCLGQRVCDAWGAGIHALGNASDGISHGQQVERRYGAGGAKAEALSGFATVRELSLPVFCEVMRDRGDESLALTQTLFTLISQLQDTNLLFRGGWAGLEFARQEAAQFLHRGGVYQAGWRTHAEDIHRRFVARKLSPGGSADLLATTLFVAHVGSRQS